MTTTEVAIQMVPVFRYFIAEEKGEGIILIPASTQEEADARLQRMMPPAVIEAVECGGMTDYIAPAGSYCEYSWVLKEE